MFWVVFFTIEFFASVVSIVAGNHGVCLPLMQVCAFYFCVKSSPWKAAPLILIFSGLLDAVWLHVFPAQLFSVGMVVIFSVWWRRFGDLYAWTSVCGAAIFCGICAWCGQWIARIGASATSYSGVTAFCGQVVASIISMILVVALLERVLARRVSTGLHDEGEEE